MSSRKNVWRYLRGLLAPLLLWVLFVAVLLRLLPSWMRRRRLRRKGAQGVARRGRARDNLPKMVRDYLDAVAAWRQQFPDAELSSNLLLGLHAEKIQEQLQSLGDPPTKMYPGQLILFPTIYRMEVRFDDRLKLPPIAWDSDLPRHPSQYRKLEYQFADGATVLVEYQLHVYKKRQRIEQDANFRLRWVSLLAVAGTVLAFSWVYLVQRRESERERQRVEAQHQIDQAERLRIEEELRRQEAERLHEEAERNLLEQRLATQAAERQALELKSRLYASIGIMAGSYAHNIKNLLVRPNDLLRRCLEADGLSGDQEQMLHEVRQTLGTVTERLQQILRTVRRDPNHSEMSRIDLNAVLRDLEHTWRDLARERWKLEIGLDLDPEPLWIEGDLSHLQQAVENLLFNARDATFEMREPPPRRGAAGGRRRARTASACGRR